MSNPDRDARLNSRAQSDSRAGRDEGDRSLTEDRQVIEKTRLEQFRRNFTAEKLPNLPEIPGYHVCWLTTTNNSDPVYRRLNLGYELIKASEIPGFENTQIKGGEFDGCVGVGEMIAAKLPLELYEVYMTEMHHTQPRQEEEKLRSVIEVIEQEATRKKGRVDVEEGSQQLGRAAGRPKFEGVQRRR